MGQDTFNIKDAWPVYGLLTLAVVSLLIFSGAIAYITFSTDPSQPKATIKIEQKLSGGAGAAFIQLTDVTRLDSATVSISDPPQYRAAPYNQSLKRGGNMTYRRSSGALQWTSAPSHNTSVASFNAPKNNGNLTVDISFRTGAYNGSGAAVLARLSNGQLRIIRCDGYQSSTSQSTQSPVLSLMERCGDKGANYHWASTERLSYNATVDSILLVTHIDSPKSGFSSDIATLFRINARGKAMTVESCPTCQRMQMLNSDGSPGSTLKYVGEGIVARGIRDGSIIEVRGTYQNQTKVIKQGLYKFEPGSLSGS